MARRGISSDSSIAKKMGTLILFGDEAGVRSDYHAGTTCGEKDERSVVPRTVGRRSLNMLSAVSVSGELRFMLVQERVSAAVFTKFLRRLMHNALQAVFLVLDRRSIHRGRPVRDFVASQEGQLRVFFLPPHRPEIGPDKQVWNYVMRHGVGKAALRGASRPFLLVRRSAP